MLILFLFSLFAQAEWAKIQSANYELKFSEDFRKIQVAAILQFEETIRPGQWLDFPKQARNELFEFIRLPGIRSRAYVFQPQDQKPRRWIRFEYVIRNPKFFKFRDLKDRGFLERYLPVSNEADRFSSRWTFDFSKTKSPAEYRVISNGLQNRSSDWVMLDFDETHRSSSVYVHVFHQKDFQIHESVYTSSKGKRIPILVYGSHPLAVLQKFNAEVQSQLKVLEQDFGEYPHEQVIVWAKDDWVARNIGGGMEYRGATDTTLYSLAHELFHFYFGRSLQPYDGNSGSLDEALASWRDRGDPVYDELDLKKFFRRRGSIGISGHSPWTRKTDSRSYVHGQMIIGYLNQKLMEQGSDMKSFLRHWFELRRGQDVDWNVFLTDLEKFAGKRLDFEVRKYLGF